MAAHRPPVTIIGAGPTGTLLAILLRRRGLDITLYEARPDPRTDRAASGRSINLALADRGIHALKAAGVYEHIAGALMPMRGRLIHREDGDRSLHLYGGRPSEVIYSISRHRLSQVLLDVATGRDGINVQFEHRLESVDFENGAAQIRDLHGRRTLRVPMTPLLAADGAGSLVRRGMAQRELIVAEEATLAHGYKELSIPPGKGGGYCMAEDALHVWPRGNFMLIALPNTDGSFTATLFLAKHGAVSFATLVTPASIENFLSSEFPDVRASMPDAVAEFQTHPTGFLGTVYADAWNVGGIAALIGDAAHAIVPFHGQGMNCCFEDCLEFDACIGRNDEWQPAFEEFFASRKSNTDAIAAMALDNYLEMRERVVDPNFRLQQLLALDLERRHPQRFIPRYSMVMFHHEIPYATAQRRGEIQNALLADLAAGAQSLDEVDFARADREISRLLESIAPDHAAG